MKTSQTTYKVLVAENNIIVAQTIIDMLVEMNVSYSLVDSGEAMVREYKNQFYDLILVDILMPGMGAIAASTTVRSMNSNIPIVAYSCLAFPDVQKQMTDAGIKHFIGQPQDFNDLKSLIAGNKRAANN